MFSSSFIFREIKPFGFLLPELLNYFAFQSLDFERTWWKLFQKRVMLTKFDIYVFITCSLHQCNLVLKEIKNLEDTHDTHSLIYMFV